jgi:hypothetical protein
MSTLLVIILVLLLLGIRPAGRRWGTRGGGLLGTIVIILLVLWLLGVLT